MGPLLRDVALDAGRFRAHGGDLGIRRVGGVFHLRDFGVQFLLGLLLGGFEFGAGLIHFLQSFLLGFARGGGSLTARGLQLVAQFVHGLAVAASGNRGCLLHFVDASSQGVAGFHHILLYAVQLEEQINACRQQRHDGSVQYRSLGAGSALFRWRRGSLIIRRLGERRRSAGRRWSGSGRRSRRVRRARIRKDGHSTSSQ